MTDKPVRVCYFGTYRANYSRNQIMIEGLRKNGIQVIECHEQLWAGVQDRVQIASGGWHKIEFLTRVITTYCRLLKKYSKVGEYDIMLLGYPGQIDTFLARLLTWLRRKPLVLDIFMSLYLIASERGLTERHPFTAFFLYWIEKAAYHLPDLLIQDTKEYVEWHGEHFGISPARFCLVPTGADDRVFYPTTTKQEHRNTLKILYYGTFIPNHGVEYIIQAAKLLQNDPNIKFELIGQGPTKPQAESLVRQFDLANVAFQEWIEKETLIQKIAEADVCLGVFGETPQSLMTIQNKIYEALAMAKPLITGESRTIRVTLQHGEHLILCKRQNPQALAQAILFLQDNPALGKQIARQGYEKFASEFTTAAIGQQLSIHLKKIMQLSA